MPACRYAEENGLTAMLTAKRSAGVAPEVNLREHVTCMNKAAHSGFETQRRHHLKSKTGVSVAPEKRTYAIQKIVLKKKIAMNQSPETHLFTYEHLDPDAGDSE